MGGSGETKSDRGGVCASGDTVAEPLEGRRLCRHHFRGSTTGGGAYPAQGFSGKAVGERLMERRASRRPAAPAAVPPWGPGGRLSPILEANYWVFAPHPPPAHSLSTATAASMAIQSTPLCRSDQGRSSGRPVNAAFFISAPSCARAAATSSRKNFA